jgi:hypothetical protein
MYIINIYRKVFHKSYIIYNKAFIHNCNILQIQTEINFSKLTVYFFSIFIKKLILFIFMCNTQV